MNEQEYKLTMKELEKELKENIDIMETNGEKARLVRVNSLEVKALSTLTFSLIPYVGLTFAMLSNDNLAAMTGSVVPGEFIPALFMVGSVGIGTAIRKILENKNNNKERFESFSDSKTETEKTLERVKYIIEKEKALNRKKAIQRAMDSIEADQNVLRKLSEISRKDVSSNVLEVQKELEQLTSLLEEKFNELDILSTQRVLHEKTWKTRTEGRYNLDAVVNGLLGGMMTMGYYVIPISGLSAQNHYGSTASSVAALLTSFVVGGGAFMGYKVKNNFDYMKAFNNINATLGEKSLPETLENAYEEYQNIEIKIDSIIKEIAAILISIQEKKRTLESLSSNNNVVEEEVEYSGEYSYSPSM